MRALEPWHLLLIVLGIVFLFGGKKIPELMRGLGSGVREFKKAAQGDDEDDKTKTDKPTVEKK